MKPQFRQFSLPHEYRDGKAFEIAASTQAWVATDALLEHYGDAIGERSRGVIDFLSEAIASAIDFDTAWDVAFGRALRTVQMDLDPVEAAVLIAMRLSSCGYTGSWRVKLAQPVSLRWDDWVLPRASEIEVGCDGIDVEARLDGQVIRGRRKGEVWSLTAGHRLETIGAGTPLLLITPAALPRDVIVEDDFHTIVGFPEITPPIVAEFEAGVRLLSSWSPRYRDWVCRIMRAIVVCACEGSRTRSSSWVEAPGCMLASTPAGALQIAEMLVHESSHQYFHLMGCIGPIDDGSDAVQYWSPAVQRHRPIGRIAIAFHAFANIVLFYRECLANGSRDDQLAATYVRLSNDVTALAEPLRKTTALTEYGRALVMPLLEELERDVVACAS